jgi:hypothetical protein
VLERHIDLAGVRHPRQLGTDVVLVDNGRRR